jgi:hypothetical protein
VEKSSGKVRVVQPENGYVTLKTLLTILGLVTGALTTSGGAALYYHTQQPHTGAAHLRDIERIERSLQRLEDKIDDLVRRHP